MYVWLHHHPPHRYLEGAQSLQLPLTTLPQLLKELLITAGPISLLKIDVSLLLERPPLVYVYVWRTSTPRSDLILPAKLLKSLVEP